MSEMTTDERLEAVSVLSGAVKNLERALEKALVQKDAAIAKVDNIQAQLSELKTKLGEQKAITKEALKNEA